MIVSWLGEGVFVMRFENGAVVWYVSPHNFSVQQMVVVEGVETDEEFYSMKFIVCVFKDYKLLKYRDLFVNGVNLFSTLEEAIQEMKNRLNFSESVLSGTEGLRYRRLWR